MTTSELSLQQQIALCEQVARLVRARLPLAGELKRLAEHSGARLSDAAKRVDEQISSGKTLAESIAGHAGRDSMILTACIEAGEQSDSLGATLENWTAMHVANANAAKALRAAMIYPMLLIGVTVASVGFVVWKLIPEYRATYLLFDQELPQWLNAIVSIREQLGILLFFFVALALLPLIVWFWRRRQFTPDALPREPAQRLRIQALATELAGKLLVANIPLTELLPLSLRACGANENDVRQVFERLRHQQPLIPLPKEASMTLTTLHAGLITSDHAADLLRDVAAHLQRQADATAQRHARWLPMLVAITVGILTILTYVFLVYLPWIALLRKIVQPALLD